MLQNWIAILRQSFLPGKLYRIDSKLILYIIVKHCYFLEPVMPSLDFKQISFNCVSEYFNNLSAQRLNEIKQSLANRVLPQGLLDTISDALNKIKIEMRKTYIEELYKNQLDEVKLTSPTQISSSIKNMTQRLELYQKKLTDLEKKLTIQQSEYISAKSKPENSVSFTGWGSQDDTYQKLNYYINNQIMAPYQNELNDMVQKLFIKYSNGYGYSEGWYSNKTEIDNKINWAIQITVLSKEITEYRDMISKTSVELADLEKLLVTTDKAHEKINPEEQLEYLTTKYKTQLTSKMLSSDLDLNKHDIFNTFVNTAKTVSLPIDISSYISDIEFEQSRINSFKNIRTVIITKLNGTDNTSFSDTQINNLIMKLNALSITAQTTSDDFDDIFNSWIKCTENNSSFGRNFISIFSCYPNNKDSINKIREIFNLSNISLQRRQPNYIEQGTSSIYEPVPFKPI